MSNTKVNPWEWDLRVLERNLKSGMIDEKDLAKHLANLPDLETQTENFAVVQPVFASDEDLDDEDDDLDDEPADDEPADDVPAS